MLFFQCLPVSLECPVSYSPSPLFICFFCLLCASAGFFSPFFEGRPSLYVHENNLACLVFMVVWPCFCYQSNKSIFALFWRESAEGLTIQYLRVNLSGDATLFSSTSDYELSNAQWLIDCGRGWGWGDASLVMV